MIIGWWHILFHDPQASYLRSWPPPSLAACSRCSSRCCPGTSGRCWGPRRRSRGAWGCMCRSSKLLPVPQQRLCGGWLSAAPGQSQTPPQRDFCPASSFAAVDRWALKILCRRDMSKTEIRNRLEKTPKYNLVLTWWLTTICDVDCGNCTTRLPTLTNTTAVWIQIPLFSSNGYVLSAWISIACSLAEWRLSLTIWQ